MKARPMRLLRDISISIKVLIPLVFLILALGIVSLLAVSGLKLQSLALKSINNSALKKIILIDEFVALSEQIQSDLFRICTLELMNLPEEEIQPLQEDLKQRLSELNSIYRKILTKWPLDETERAILERIRGPMDAFRLQALEVCIAVSEKVPMVRLPTLPFAEFRDMLTEFLNYKRSEITRTETVYKEKSKKIAKAITSLVLLITLVGIFTTIMISTWLICRPIKSITDLMRHLANGELSIDIGYLERRDEIGSMARAVEVFRNNAIEKARSDKALRESEMCYRSLFDNAPMGIGLSTPDGKVLAFNNAMLNMTGYSEKELEQINLKDFYQNPKERELLLKQLQKGYTVHNFEVSLKRKDDRPYWVSLTIAPFVLADKDVFLTMAEDITERKHSEKKLQEKEKAMEAILNASIDAAFLIDTKGTYLSVNKALAERLGKRIDELVGSQGYDALPSEVAEIRKEVVQEVIRTKKPIRFEDRRNGFYLDNSLYPVFDAEARVIGIAVFSHDITKHKRSEEQIKASLAEKEVLLREVHHRVKNNLQALICLIDMQCEMVKSSEALRRLGDLKGRVRAMALVHEKLYQAENLAQINFKDYLDDLTLNLFHCFGAGRAISLHVDAQELSINVNIAIPCGLIVNELVTNALKHAFLKDTGGQIRVEFGLVDGEYMLMVADNGIGIPSELDLQKAESLGLKLVNILAKYQLGASLELDTHNGTIFKMRFRERKQGGSSDV